MTNYYIFAKESDIDAIIEDLSHMPSDTITSVVVKDNSGVMPTRYIRVHTELLTDAGLVDMIKKTTAVFSKKVRIMKELQSVVTLI